MTEIALNTQQDECNSQTHSKLLQEFKTLYEKLLEARRISKSSKKNLCQEAVMKKWIHDVTEQNELLVDAFKCLETMENDRIDKIDALVKENNKKALSEDILKVNEELEMLYEKSKEQKEKIIALKNKICDMQEKTYACKDVTLKGGFECDVSLDEILTAADETKGKLDQNMKTNVNLAQALIQAKQELVELREKQEKYIKENYKKINQSKLNKLKRQKNLHITIVRKTEELNRARQTLQLAADEKKTLMDKMKEKLVYSDATLTFFHDLNKRVYCGVEKWKNASNRLIKFQSYYQFVKMSVERLKNITDKFPQKIKMIKNQENLGNQLINNSQCQYSEWSEYDLRCLLKKKMDMIECIKKKINFPLDLDCTLHQQRYALLNILNREIHMYRMYMMKNREIHKFICCTNYFG